MGIVIRGSLVALLCAVTAAQAAAAAQDASSQDGRAASEPEQHDHPPPSAEEQASQQVHEHGAAASLFSTREASGTSWLPDTTPVYGAHRHAGAWELMFHGNAFLQLVHEAAPEHRGATQVGSINWGMLMASRPVGAARIGVRTMVSLEPWTIGGCGYPNLLATGEFCNGDNIHDRQHPHDLLMEVAVQVDRPLTAGLHWQVYGGVAGEPALGPPAFPHRTSAMSNPLSPISHHWIDATHITFGVVTAGMYGSQWKAEGSLFNGREPDENRRDLDLAALDSFSARVWWLPGDALALQVSAGYLRDGERLHASAPAVDVTRTTASATYHRGSANGTLWATTIAWGSNREAGTRTHALLGESTLSLSRGHTWFGRAELNGKPAHDLHVHELEGEIFTVGKLQAGYTRYLGSRHGLVPGIGASVSAAIVPAVLRPRYGGIGTGVAVFVTVRPAGHGMAP